MVKSYITQEDRQNYLIKNLEDIAISTIVDHTSKNGKRLLIDYRTEMIGYNGPYSTFNRDIKTGIKISEHAKWLIFNSVGKTYLKIPLRKMSRQLFTTMPKSEFGSETYLQKNNLRIGSIKKDLLSELKNHLESKTDFVKYLRDKNINVEYLYFKEGWPE